MFKHSKVKKLKEKEALIDELTNSHENASSILTIYAEHAQKQKEEEAKVIVPKVGCYSHFNSFINLISMSTFLE